MKTKNSTGGSIHTSSFFSKKNLMYGFTLIELMIVIAIIGMLSTIILANLSNSRKQAKNSTIKNQMQSMKSEAELMYASNNGSYANVCTNQATKPNPYALYSAARAQTGGTTGKCNTSASAYAASVPIATNPTNSFWCVDYKGAGKSITSAQFSALSTVCP